LPSNIQKYGLNFAWLFLILGVVLIFTVRSAQGWGWIMSLISVFVIYGGGGTTQAFEQEKERRKLALKSAKQTHNDIKSKITTFVQNNLFSNEVQRLNGLRTEYEAMANREKREIQHLSVTAEERQKQKFLSTCFINNSDIHGIGSSFKASLRSFGIETASDVSKQKVRQVRGFGDVRTRAMLDWKASCERRFKFNLSIAVSQQDINAVRVKIMQEKSRIESELISAPRQLQRLKMKVLAEHSYLSNLLEDTEKKLAQAQADYDNL
jgi:DNA-binding helix-hairpin-helix protein with protein kinase domain